MKLMRLYENGKNEKTSRKFDTQYNPNKGITWYNKGVTLTDLCEHNAALECYDKALKICPENEYAWHNKGFTLMALDRYEEALECYNKALKIDPYHEFANNNRELVLKKLRLVFITAQGPP